MAKIVFARSGDCCAMPDCHRPLVLGRSAGGDREALVAKLAHIAGLRPGSARYDAAMSDEERNSAGNLMAVCPSCHDKIDAQPLDHTAERLRKIKNDHEAWADSSLKKGMHELTIPELDEVISRIVARYAEPATPHVIRPAVKLSKKIARNRLSAWAGGMIGAGLARVKLVAECINESPDPTLAGRLKAGMAREYERLRGEGMDGDDLFYALWGLAGRGGGMKRAAAGLAVLVYFFEACEVFES